MVASLCLCGSISMAFGQSAVIVGDMDSNNLLDVTDVTLLTNTILGQIPSRTISGKCDPNIPDVSCIVGTWTFGGHVITLREDGTATCSEHSSVRKYEYYPCSRDLIMMNSDEKIICAYDIVRIKGGRMVARLAEGKFVTYYSENYVPTVVHEFVDLALPSGTLWATCNVGADSQEGIGCYFAWGEVVSFDESQNHYNEGNYKYNSETGELKSEYDAAYCSWGAEWCLPSANQMAELFNDKYTTLASAEVGGVQGCIVTSKENGNSIFLPCTGYMDGATLKDSSYGCYWTSNVYTSDTRYAVDYRIYPSTKPSIQKTAPRQNYGLVVRPVKKVRW